MQHEPHDTRVIDANRRFYDAVANVYEQVDRRRTDERAAWLDRVFDDVTSILAENKRTTDLHFVDAGAGTGFLARQVAHRFAETTLLDVSQRMLDRIDLRGARKLCADVCKTSLSDASVDVVGAFATLHHLHEPRDFFAEAFRILRPGGVLYTDHDIEATFVRNFRAPLAVYRAFFDHGRGYLRACPSLSAKDYELSEFHGHRGLSGAKLFTQLRSLGFLVVHCRYHWEGMGSASEILKRLRLRDSLSARGFAPIVRLVAVKPMPPPVVRKTGNKTSLLVS